MGVGPGQNFTYIVGHEAVDGVHRGRAARELRSAADVQGALRAVGRSGGVRVAAVLEETAGRPRRADRRPPTSSAAFWNVERAIARCSTRTWQRSTDDLLVKKHGFALVQPDDLEGIEYVYDAFYQLRSAIQYSSTSSFGGSLQPTYADLMTAHRPRRHGAQLSGDRRELPVHEGSRNPQHPGAGRRQLRRPEGHSRGRPVPQREGRDVSAFYLSNVEQYLRQDGIWDDFCANVATLPLDDDQHVHPVRSPHRRRGARDSALRLRAGQHACATSRAAGRSQHLSQPRQARLM